MTKTSTITRGRKKAKRSGSWYKRMKKQLVARFRFRKDVEMKRRFMAGRSAG
jgi:hypothetical protein